MIFGMNYHNFYYICKRINKMTDRQHELLIKMVLKINEAKTYNRISGILTFLWIFELIYFIFWDQMVNVIFYLTICLFCILGCHHMNSKFKKCINEYEKLNEEYENLL